MVEDDLDDVLWNLLSGNRRRARLPYHARAGRMDMDLGLGLDGQRTRSRERHAKATILTPNWLLTDWMWRSLCGSLHHPPPLYFHLSIASSAPPVKRSRGHLLLLSKSLRAILWTCCRVSLYPFSSTPHTTSVPQFYRTSWASSDHLSCRVLTR